MLSHCYVLEPPPFFSWGNLKKTNVWNSLLSSANSGSRQNGVWYGMVWFSRLFHHALYGGLIIQHLVVIIDHEFNIGGVVVY